MRPLALQPARPLHRPRLRAEPQLRRHARQRRVRGHRALRDNVRDRAVGAGSEEGREGGLGGGAGAEYAVGGEERWAQAREGGEGSFRS